MLTFDEAAKAFRDAFQWDTKVQAFTASACTEVFGKVRGFQVTLTGWKGGNKYGAATAILGLSVESADGRTLYNTHLTSEEMLAITRNATEGVKTFSRLAGWIEAAKAAMATAA